MVILNNSDQQRTLDVTRFEECLKGTRKGKDVISGMDVNLEGLVLGEKTAEILEIK
jgi:hypothetical protein